jgi:hypothetical protein
VEVPIGESRWLIERTYAKGAPAERREFWLGLTPGDTYHDSFDSSKIWTTNAIEAARFSSQNIAETLRYRYFHSEAPVEACEHLFQCGISPDLSALRQDSSGGVLEEALTRMDRARSILKGPNANWAMLDTADLRKNLAAPQESRSEVLEAAKELADLMDEVVEGNYKPDHFTTQPLRRALASRTSGAGVGEKKVIVIDDGRSLHALTVAALAEHEPEHAAIRDLGSIEFRDGMDDEPASAAPDPHDELIFDGQLDQGVAAAPSVDYARGLEDAAKVCERFQVEGQNPLTTMARAIRQDCANAIRAKISPLPPKGST